MLILQTRALRRIALLTAVLLPALSACAGTDFTAASQSPYYANITNPVPELSGQMIVRSDVRQYATPLNPHPELTGFPDVAIANGPASTQAR